MLVEITDEERDILVRWKKRADSFKLVRMKVEVVLYASRGVDSGIIAEMVERTESTVRDWLRAWGKTRLHSVVTGHADNENTAKLTRPERRAEEHLGGPARQRPAASRARAPPR